MMLNEIEIDLGINSERRRRKSERYLRGPIGFKPLSEASRIGGRALAVYLAIHHQMALSGKTKVTLPKSLLSDMGVDKDAKARALKSLKEADLIDIETQTGTSTLISLKTEQPQFDSQSEIETLIAKLRA